MKDGRIIETGTTQELVERMKGKVWGSTILARELPSCEKRLRIVNLKNEPDGRDNDPLSFRRAGNGNRRAWSQGWRICICGCSRRECILRIRLLRKKNPG